MTRTGSHSKQLETMELNKAMSRLLFTAKQAAARATAPVNTAAWLLHGPLQPCGHAPPLCAQSAFRFEFPRPARAKKDLSPNPLALPGFRRTLSCLFAATSHGTALQPHVSRDSHTLQRPSPPRRGAPSSARSEARIPWTKGVLQK